MKKCDVIRDLMPLYLEDICSESSKELVEEHIKECEECRRIFKQMSSEFLVDPIVLDEAIDEKELLDKGKKQIAKEVSDRSLGKLVKIDWIINALIMIFVWVVAVFVTKNPVTLIFVVPVSIFLVMVIAEQLKFIGYLKRNEADDYSFHVMMARMMSMGSLICKVPIVIAGLVCGIGMLLF